MRALYPAVVRDLKKELKRYGYRLSIKPSVSLANDFTAKVEKVIGKETRKIFSTRNRKELLQGINLISKLERLYQEGGY